MMMMMMTKKYTAGGKVAITDKMTAESSFFVSQRGTYDLRHIGHRVIF